MAPQKKHVRKKIKERKIKVIKDKERLKIKVIYFTIYLTNYML